MSVVCSRIEICGVVWSPSFCSSLFVLLSFLLLENIFPKKEEKIPRFYSVFSFFESSFVISASDLLLSSCASSNSKSKLLDLIF